MRSRNSESFIVLPLLPIFLLGAFPMLLLSLMGPAGLVILGILIASVGLTDVLESNSAYSEQIIVHAGEAGELIFHLEESVIAEVELVARAVG